MKAPTSDTDYEYLKHITDFETFLTGLGDSETRKKLVTYVERVDIPEGKWMMDWEVLELKRLHTVNGTIAVTELSSISLVSTKIQGPLSLRVTNLRAPAEMVWHDEFLRYFKDRVSSYPTDPVRMVAESQDPFHGFSLSYEPGGSGHTFTYHVPSGVGEVRIREVRSLIRQAHHLKLSFGGLGLGDFPSEVSKSHATDLTIRGSYELREILQAYVVRAEKKSAEGIEWMPPLQRIFFPPLGHLTRSFQKSLKYPFPIQLPGYIDYVLHLPDLARIFPRLSMSIGVCLRENSLMRAPRYKELTKTLPIETLDSLNHEELATLIKARSTFPSLCVIPYEAVWSHTK